MNEPPGIHAMPLGQFPPCDAGETGGVAVGTAAVRTGSGLAGCCVGGGVGATAVGVGSGLAGCCVGGGVGATAV
ncbi:MAG TPA: hypothetical protein PLM08_23915, partial [Polyangiaceae bacterium]|nr:hypothetical protein [Polyangiaceae bacterium]